MRSLASTKLLMPSESLALFQEIGRARGLEFDVNSNNTVSTLLYIFKKINLQVLRRHAYLLIEFIL